MDRMQLKPSVKDNKISRPRNLLILSYVFPPFWSIGGSIRVVKFIKYLCPLGWRPVVLTISDEKEYDTQKKVGSEVLLQEIPDEVKIYRTSSGEPSADFLEKGRNLRKKSLAAPIINLLGRTRGLISSWFLIPDSHITWLPFAVRKGRKIIRDESIDIIFATCPPHSVGIIGAVLKCLSRKPLILDYRDDWIDTPWFKQKSRIRKQIERWLEKWIVKKADRFIAVTDRSLHAFQDRYPSQPKAKFVLIPNGSDLEDFDFVLKPAKCSEEKYFSIVHTGILSDFNELHDRNPVTFFQALSNLRGKVDGIEEEIKVTFTGQLPKRYRAIVEEMGLQNMIREVGHLPHQDFVETLSQAHLLLAVNTDGFSTVIPGKIYQYWAIGGPPVLLLSCCGAAADLVENNSLGITVDPHNLSGIEDAIFDAFQKYKAGSPPRISRQGIEKYDRKALTVRLSQVMSEVSRLNQ